MIVALVLLNVLVEAGDGGGGVHHLIFIALDLVLAGFRSGMSKEGIEMNGIFESHTLTLLWFMNLPLSICMSLVLSL